LPTAATLFSTAAGRSNTAAVGVHRRYIIHATSTYALAVLENVVHWRIAELPPGQQFVQVSIPAAVSRSVLNPDDLPGWDAYPYGASQAYGDAWYDAGETAVLVGEKSG